MSIVNMLPDTDPEWYSEGFLLIVDQHISYMQQNDSRIVNVTAHQSVKFNGDLGGLLDDLNVPKKFHYAVMRLNGYTNLNQFGREGGPSKRPTALIIPDPNILDSLMNIYRSSL